MDFTNSTYFLLRGLNIVEIHKTIDESEIYLKYGFKNAYIADKRREDDLLDCPLYLLFKPPHPESFNEFLDYEYEVGTLKYDYDYPGGYIVLLYDFPILYRKDYKLVIDGKYSHVSEEFKKMFPMEYKQGTIMRKTIVYHVFNRTKERQGDLERELELDEGTLDGVELWSTFDTEKETLDVDKIINNGVTTG